MAKKDSVLRSHTQHDVSAQAKVSILELNLFYILVHGFSEVVKKLTYLI